MLKSGRASHQATWFLKVVPAARKLNRRSDDFPEALPGSAQRRAAAILSTPARARLDDRDVSSWLFL
jgi:hypothetical protein